MKKVSSVRPKRTLNLKTAKKEDTGEKGKEKTEKSMNANKLLKFYAMMELNKRQFLEDYIFEQQAEEQQKKRLYNNLMEKNKFNNEQIKDYRKKCDGFNPSTHSIQTPNPSSDENTSIYRN